MLPWFQTCRPPLFLAPMAGVTNSVFRQLCKGLGADVLTSEFVSADGILHRNQRTREMIEFQPSERPVGVQLFGADPTRMAEAARAVIDWVNPDFVDLNFGCPVNKVVNRHGGSALLRDCPLLQNIVRAVVRAAKDTPVTGKIRIGWDAATINAVETARILEGEGAQAVVVHGRTKDQGYSGEANWEVIRQVAAAVRIPVIGNGDLRSPSEIAHQLSRSGVRGVMIGRAAMGYPWIFAETRTFLTTRILPEPISLKERWNHIIRHCELTVTSSEKHALCSLRGHLLAYSKGMLGGRRIREALSRVESVAEVRAVAALAISLAEEAALVPVT